MPEDARQRQTAKRTKEKPAEEARVDEEEEELKAQKEAGKKLPPKQLLTAENENLRRMVSRSSRLPAK